MKPIKFLQKIGHDDFKDISAQARSGTLHVIRDPQPGAIKPDHIIGRVSSAFNLGKKVEVMADFVYWGPEKQDLKFAKVDSVWYLTVINKPEKP